MDRAEPTTRGKAHDDERMMQFMFTNRPLEKVPCQLAEEFKIRLKTALFAIMVRKGGTVTSILREAFQAWDQDSSGELNTKEFVGAIGRCGLQIDDNTAHQLVNYYDRKGEQGRFGDGEIHYMDLVEELGKTRVPRRPPCVVSRGDDHATPPQVPPLHGHGEGERISRP